MIKKINNININYQQYGEGEDLVFLHGWGQNIEMMLPLANRLSNKKRITILDFPGFGSSEEPKNPYTIYDYVDVLEKLLKELNVKKPTLIAHSFGGRVAIVYASRNNVSKVVLFGSPCIRKEVNSKKIAFYKKVKKLPGMNKISEIAKNYLGSPDYKNASLIMRKTLVNVINQDLSEEAKKIEAPTLLIWGTNDQAAPLEDAKQLEKLLKDGALIELEGYTHYAYLEAIDQVTNILNNFINNQN